MTSWAVSKTKWGWEWGSTGGSTFRRPTHAHPCSIIGPLSLAVSIGHPFTSLLMACRGFPQRRDSASSEARGHPLDGAGEAARGDAAPAPRGRGLRGSVRT